MSFYSYIRRKLLRFLSSRIVLKFNYFFHLLFGEKNLGNIGFDFSQKHTRKFIVQDIIDKKNEKKLYDKLIKKMKNIFLFMTIQIEIFILIKNFLIKI